MADTSFVSVVIPTYNRGSRIIACIDSVYAQDYPPDRFEVLVVDDGSTDDTGEALAKYSDRPNFRYIRQENKGASSARNHGIRSAKGEIACFIDDDCIAEVSWLWNLVKRLEDKSIGGVGGRIVAARPVSLIERYCERNKFFDQESFVEVMLMGANAAYRMDLLKSLGGFDEFFRTGEDTELGLRVRLAGYKLTYAQEAVVLHHHMSSFWSMLRQIYGYGKGYASLNKKYIKNFRPVNRAMKQSLRLLRKVLVSPFKIILAFAGEEKIYHILEPFLDISILAANICGLLVEVLAGRSYPSEKTTYVLDFIKEANLPGGWGL